MKNKKSPKRLIEFKSWGWVGVLALGFCLSLYLFLFNLPGTPNLINGDGESYYAYLPGIFLYHDWLNPDPERYESGREFLEHPAFYRSPATNRYVDKYPPGVAILVAPFFFWAGLISKALNLVIDGYNPVFQFWVGLSGVGYLSLGLWFLYRFYRQWFSGPLTMALLGLLVFGTNLLTYTVFHPLYSHIYSFSLTAIFLYLTDRWYHQPQSRIRTIQLVITWGALILVRNTNILLGIFWLFYGVDSWARLNQRVTLLKTHWRSGLLLVGSITVLVFPQLLYHQLVTSQWLVFSYAGESFRWLDPAWYGVLFSPRRGLLFWTPALLVGLFSLMSWKSYRPWFFPGLLYLGAQLYLIASWHQWWFGDGFGHRAFIDSYPVMGLYLGAGLKNVLKGRFRLLMMVCLSLAVSLNLWLSWQYWTGTLPRDHITLERWLMSLGLK